MRRVCAVGRFKTCNDIGLVLNTRDWRYGLLWRLGVETGLRISDLLRLTASDAAKICADRKLEVRMIKTQQNVVISPSKAILNEIADYMLHRDLKANEFLFYSTSINRGRPLSRQHVWRVLRAAGASLSVSRVGTHTMRRTFALRHYRARRSVSALQTRLGHRYISSTLCYLLDGDKLLT